MTTATNAVLATSIDSSTTLSLGTNSTSTTLGSQTQPTTINANNLTLYASGSGTNGQVLTQGNTYATWQAPSFVGTADKDLDMNGNAINNITSLNSITTMNINGQTQFDLPPHVPTPLLGNDAASKGYVDTLIGNYSGSGLNLYLNKSQPSINQLGSFILSTTVSSAPLQTEQTTALGTTLIASFITPTGFPNLKILPIGLWQMTVYGYTTSNTGTLVYSFKLYKQPLVGVAVLIGTSGDSSDVNATSAIAPDAFHMSLAITSPVTMLLTDCLLVDVISVGTGMIDTVKLNTVFEDGYYSFVNTNLSGGTSLLTTDNTWTGINNFSLGVKTGAVDLQTPAGLTIGTVEATSINIGRAGIITTAAGTLATTTLTATSLQNNSLTSNGVSSIINHYINNSGGTYSLFTGTGRTGTTNIQTGATGANAINIGSTTSTTSIKGTLTLGTVGSSSTINAPLLSGYSYATATGTTTAGSIGVMVQSAYLVSSPTGYVTDDNIIHGTVSIARAGVYSFSSTLEFQCVTVGVLTRAHLYFDILNNVGASVTTIGNTVLVGPTVSIAPNGFLYLSANSVYSFASGLTYPYSANLRFSIAFSSGAYNKVTTPFVCNLVKIA
jgi:hypothetical protein